MRWGNRQTGAAAAAVAAAADPGRERVRDRTSLSHPLREETRPFSLTLPFPLMFQRTFYLGKKEFSLSLSYAAHWVATAVCVVKVSLCSFSFSPSPFSSPSGQTILFSL